MPLLVTVDRFEGEQAVLRLADGQELVVPVAALPTEAHEGSQFQLTLSDSSATEAATRTRARELLSAILRKE